MRRFLFAMISADERGRVETLLPEPVGDRPLSERRAYRGKPMESLPDNAAHILVVDDDQRIRDCLARYLFKNGFRVTTAADATHRARRP